MAAVRYTDMIGKPYERGAWGPDSYGCAGVALEILRRLGRDVGREAFTSPGGEAWEAIEEPCQPGDIILSDGPDGSHVDVLLDYRRKSVLTALVGLGVSLRNLHSISHRVGAFRLR